MAWLEITRDSVLNGLVLKIGNDNSIYAVFNIIFEFRCLKYQYKKFCYLRL